MISQDYIKKMLKKQWQPGIMISRGADTMVWPFLCESVYVLLQVPNLVVKLMQYAF